MGKYIAIYLLVLTCYGVLVMGKDKRAARKKIMRVPEKHLFRIALLGGSVGVLIGMYWFRHKTKHVSFTIGIPAIIMLQCLIGYMIVIGFL